MTFFNVKNFRSIKPNGFTLVELVIIITIIGVLAMFVTPRFIDMRSRATRVAIKSVANGLNAASAANYQLSRTDPKKAIPIRNCNQLEQTLPADHPLPEGYEIVPKEILNDQAICELRHKATATTEYFMGYRTAQ